MVVLRRPARSRDVASSPDRRMKLTIELVPRPCHGVSIPEIVPAGIWKQIREKVIRNFDHKCAICGASDDTLHCHENWQYNNRTYVRRLSRIIPLCTLCHWVKHASLAKAKAQFGYISFSKVVKHFMAVNKCNHKLFFATFDEAEAICKERSTHHWETDFGQYSELVAPYMDAA